MDAERSAEDGAERPPIEPEAPTLESPVPPSRVARGAEEGSRWTRPPQDLSEDWMLRGAQRVAFEGQERPSVGRVVLLSRLGRGGMGVVYHGVNPRLASEVAVKLLPRGLEEQEEGLRDRFLREAQTAARLRSPHLVAVFDVDRDPGTGHYFLVMEYVHGASARGWLERVRAAGREGVPESEALDLCIAAARGLAAAHVAGVVHRDVKPDNILVPEDPEGRLDLAAAKLADLGLARADAADSGLTATRLAIGTPGYMAPEQATDAKRAKKPADVFGMGATLYSLLGGKAPFAADSSMEALLRTVEGRYRPLAELRPDVSAATLALVAQCLEREPARRYTDAPALLEALELCRAALGRPAGTGDSTVHLVRGLAERPEQGARAATDPGATPAPTTDSIPVLRTEIVAREGDSPAPRSRRRAWAVPAVLVAAATATWLAWPGGDEPTPPAPPPSEPAVAEPPAEPPGPPSPELPAADAAPAPAEPSPPPAPTTGRIELGALPADAAAFLGDRPLSPAEELPPGRHALTLRRAAHQDVPVVVEVTPGETSPLPRVEWIPLPGRLDLAGVAPDVRLTLDDGRALRDGDELPPGSRRVTASLAGHAPQEIVLEVLPGVAARPTLGEWRPLPGRLDLSGHPGVAFLLDGRPLEDGAELPPGRHVLRATLAGHEDQTVAVEIAADAATRPVLGPWVDLALRDAQALVADLARWDAASPAERRAAAEVHDARRPDLELDALRTYSSGGSAHEMAVYRHLPTGMTFVLVPGGTFWMGSPENEPDRQDDERLHPVALSPFLVSQTEVPQSVFEHFGGLLRCDLRRADLPVHEVSWREAAEFCGRSGTALPTEAQWEYACRAGTRTRFSFGESLSGLSAHSWWKGNSGGRPRPVAELAPNAFGLFDVHGNVHEWCRDAYGRYPEGAVQDPGGRPEADIDADDDADRVYRGGSFHGGAFNKDEDRHRSAWRGKEDPDDRSERIGFRVVLPLE